VGRFTSPKAKLLDISSRLNKKFLKYVSDMFWAIIGVDSVHLLLLERAKGLSNSIQMSSIRFKSCMTTFAKKILYALG
jgi:hypothetical protein